MNYINIMNNIFIKNYYINNNNRFHFYTVTIHYNTLYFVLYTLFKFYVLTLPLKSRYEKYIDLENYFKENLN